MIFAACARLSTLFFTSCDYPEWPESDEPFRVALSLSPFSLNQFEEGYSFKVGDGTAATPDVPINPEIMCAQKEVAYFEPAIIIGYNFGHKKKK